jgi:hypothetical protein
MRSRQKKTRGLPGFQKKTLNKTFRDALRDASTFRTLLGPKYWKDTFKGHKTKHKRTSKREENKRKETLKRIQNPPGTQERH